MLQTNTKIRIKQREKESEIGEGREASGDASVGHWRVTEALEGLPRHSGLHGPL